METLFKLELARVIRKETKPSVKKRGFDDAILSLGVVVKPKK